MLLRDEKGKPNGILSMIQDITEQSRLEERLRDIAYSLSGVKAGESYLVGSTHKSLKIAFVSIVKKLIVYLLLEKIRLL